MNRPPRHTRIIQRRRSKAFVSAMRRGCAGCYDKPSCVIEFIPENKAIFQLAENQGLFAPICKSCLAQGIPLDRLEEMALFLFGLAPES